jgi:5'-nucleotidase
MSRPSLRERVDGPIILLTNDDGVRAPGIVKLARALRALGRVVVVAPDQQRSAASHSITLHRPLRVEKLRRDVYAIDGTPADCIMLGVH